MQPRLWINHVKSLTLIRTKIELMRKNTISELLKTEVWKSKYYWNYSL